VPLIAILVDVGASICVGLDHIPVSPWMFKHMVEEIIYEGRIVKEFHERG